MEGFFLESLTCSPLHRVTAPIIRMWFQLKSRTCNVSFMAEIKIRKIFIKRWNVFLLGVLLYYGHTHLFYIKFEKIKYYSLSAFPICIAPDSSISLLLRFNHTMLTFPYKIKKVISLFVWSCSRISNLNKNVFPSEGIFLVILLHLNVETRHPTNSVWSVAAKKSIYHQYAHPHACCYMLGFFVSKTHTFEWKLMLYDIFYSSALLIP